MREKIAEIIRLYANNRESWAGSFIHADQILSLFREEIEKLKPLSDEEIIKGYGDSFWKRNIEIDVPGGEELEALEELAQAQLTKTKEDLRKV